jgi:hypothetical protein
LGAVDVGFEPIRCLEDREYLAVANASLMVDEPLRAFCCHTGILADIGVPAGSKHDVVDCRNDPERSPRSPWFMLPGTISRWFDELWGVG